MASSYTVNNIIEQDNLNSGINSYIKILTPIQFTLETCCQSDDNAYLNFLMTSPRENTFYHFQTKKEIHQFNNRAPHIHDFYELLIVLDGEIHQQIEQSDLVFHSGNCCLMNHNIVHKEVFSSDATLLFIGMSKELVKQLSDDEQKVYFPDIEMPGINPILKFLTDNLDNPDTKEYLDFLPALNNKDWHHTLHAITDNILRAIMFPKLGSTYIIKGMLLELFDYLADPTHFHFTPILVKKTGSMQKVNFWGYVISDILGIFLIFFAMQKNLSMMLLFMFLKGTFAGTMSGTLNALIAEISGYTYRTKGVHIDGMMFSCSSLGVKVGGGIGTAAVGWLLNASGYVGTAATQTSGAINMIFSMYITIPVILGVVITVLLGLMTVEKENKRIDMEREANN